MEAMGGANILLVDDDQDLCAWLSGILTDHGYTVDMAHDGRSALELSEQNRYRLAVLDYRMPGMDGLELCRCLRGMQTTVVVALVTPFASAAISNAAFVAGVRRVLLKPVDFGVLMPLAEESVGRDGDRTTGRTGVLQSAANRASGRRERRGGREWRLQWTPLSPTIN